MTIIVIVTTAGHRCVDPGESHAPRTHTRANKSGIGVGIPTTTTTTTTTKTIAAAFILRKKGRACIWKARGSLTRRSGASACASAEFLFYCCSCRKRSTQHAGRQRTFHSRWRERVLRATESAGVAVRNMRATAVAKCNLSQRISAAAARDDGCGGAGLLFRRASTVGRNAGPTPTRGPPRTVTQPREAAAAARTPTSTMRRRVWNAFTVSPPPPPPTVVV
ncbi:hypothetical protein QTP88_006869 [Uroleucon formosanum]